MRTLRVLVCGLIGLVGLTVVAGCKKEAAGPAAGMPAAPASTRELDALWKLAPEGAALGVVASPRGVAMIERGYLAVRALLAAAPELAPLGGELEGALTKVSGAPNPTLADFGITRDKGAAVFQTDHGPLAILPVGDRDKFLAKLHGMKGTDADTLPGATCKTINGLYACAQDAELLGKLGHGGLAATLATTGTRGDLELVLHDATRSQGPGAAVVAQIEPGMVVLRGTITGVPRSMTSQLGAPTRPRNDAASATGFGVINLAPLLANLPASPITAKVTLADLGRSIAGPVTFAIARGTGSFDLRISLVDPEPAKALVDHCTDVPSLAAAGATVEGGACHVPIPQAGLAIDARVDGKELRIATQGPPSADGAVPASPIATELANGDWSVAFYGHGTLLGATLPPGLLALQHLPAEAQIGLRAIMMMNELAVGLRGGTDTIQFVVGVRTAWANPADVVQKLIAISAEQVVAGKAVELARPIADAAPGSPFARDFKAGTGGVMALVAPLGIYAAVAIPAFMDYMKRSKKTEADLQLNKIGKNAKRIWNETADLPRGEAPLTPATSCCSGPNHHCVTTPADWQHPIWQALDFEIDEPSLFQYSYESDGKGFIAKAVGDLDCDGIPITYELRGELANGNLTTTLIPPPPNAD